MFGTRRILESIFDLIDSHASIMDTLLKISKKDKIRMDILELRIKNLEDKNANKK